MALPPGPHPPRVAIKPVHQQINAKIPRGVALVHRPVSVCVCVCVFWGEDGVASPWGARTVQEARHRTPEVINWRKRGGG